MMHSPLASLIAPRAPQLAPRAGLGLKAEHFQDVLDTRPDVGVIEPATIAASVVFPAPVEPTSATRSPARRLSVTPWSTS